MENIAPDVVERVVKQIAKSLRESYAFPEVGEKLARAILAQLDGGAYGGIASYPHLGAQITTDLREVVRDLHLAVYYHPEEAAALERKAKQEDLDKPDLHWWRNRPGMPNYGLQKLEILAGNIGYFKILVLAPASLVGEKIISAMNFLADCDALIFDLRECIGGDPFTIQLIESYLFTAEPKLMLTMYDRTTEKTQQIWTLPSVPGKRMPDVPVYILTSSKTFSGGEDFSYTMKHHGRAIIVGETTGGGGHTVEFMPAGDGFVLALPTGYPTHPVTGENWEGKGVQPDIEVSESKALQAAHLHAVENLSINTTDEQKKRILSAALMRQKAIYQPVSLDYSYLKSLVGVYGAYQARVVNGRLILGEEGDQNGWQMLPISGTHFMVDEEYDVEFEFDSEGLVTALVWHEIASGRRMRSEKK
jgi:hypothetical protein